MHSIYRNLLSVELSVIQLVKIVDDLQLLAGQDQLQMYVLGSKRKNDYLSPIKVVLRKSYRVNALYRTYQKYQIAQG
ncbi:MAG: hypothetical protein ACK5M7_13275 [Draconibacterium sp.]